MFQVSISQTMVHRPNFADSQISLGPWDPH